MKLDARKGDTNWRVWHVGRCRILDRVVWVDSDRATYGEYGTPPRIKGREIAIHTRQARRIEILPAPRIVLIDPVDDVRDEGEIVTVGKSRRKVRLIKIESTYGKKP